MTPAYPHEDEAALRQTLRAVFQNHLALHHLSLNAAMLTGLWVLSWACRRYCEMLELPLAAELDHVRGWLTHRVRDRDDVPPLVLSDEASAADDDALTTAKAQAGRLYTVLGQLIDETAVERGIRIDVLLNVTLGLMADVLCLLQDTLGWDLEDVEAFIDDELHEDLTADTQAQQHRGR